MSENLEARVAELESTVGALTAALLEVTNLRVRMSTARQYPKPCDGNWTLFGTGKVREALEQGGLAQSQN